MSAVPTLAPAFADPVRDSQAAFRNVLSAIAYPGRIFSLDGAAPRVAPLGAATTALCLSLADFETPVWLDRLAATPNVEAYLRFHCGARFAAGPAEARFAVIADALSMPGLLQFDQGHVEYPERSATLLVEVPSLERGRPTRWTGPGIKAAIDVAVDGLPAWFWEQWQLNHELYPLGVDVAFTCGHRLIGLPRSIRVEV